MFQVSMALDRLQPRTVTIKWSLYDATVIIDDTTVHILRNELSGVENLLKMRGYKKANSGFHPFSGMEGTAKYVR
jgi:hypothetical protein